MAEEVGSSVVGVDHPDGAPFGQGVWISGAIPHRVSAR